MEKIILRYGRASISANLFFLVFFFSLPVLAETAYVTTFTGSTPTACPPYCTVGGFISSFGSTDVSAAPGVPQRSRAAFGFAGIPSWTIQPTLDMPGGVYRIDVAHNSSSNLPVVSRDVLVTVSSSDGSLSASCVNTPVFQRAYGGPVWNTIGYITNNPGVTEPVLVFTVSGGSVGPTSISNRLYIDAFKFSGLSTPPPVIPPSITQQPSSRTNIAGTVATFAVTATGTGPLIYRWRNNQMSLFDGGRVLGAATASLTLANVEPMDVARYTVEVANVAGSVTSADAFLHVSIPPVARINVSPLAQFPEITNLVVIGANGVSANVILDGSGSSSDSHAPLQYQWFDATNFLGDTVTITNVFAVGPHTFTLLVSDGVLQDTDTAEVEIITTSEAVAVLIQLLQESDLSLKEQRPLLATLRAVLGSFERGNLTSAFQQLGAFQNKVQAQVAHANPTLAEQLITSTQIIMDATARLKPVTQNSYPRIKHSVVSH